MADDIMAGSFVVRQSKTISQLGAARTESV
jgi:hypothetical protein